MVWWDKTESGSWRLLDETTTKDGGRYLQTIIPSTKTKDGEAPILQYPFIYQGSADMLIDSLKDKTVDLILTDPPYGITQNRWDEKPRWKEIAKQYNRILKDNGLIAIFGTVPNIIDVYNEFQDFFDFRYDIVWVKGAKTAMWMSNFKPLRTHENIFVFCKKNTKPTATTFNIKQIGEKGKPYTIKRTITTTNQGDWNNKNFESKSDGIRFPVSVPGVGGSDKEYIGVPTQKPEKIIELLIRGLSNPSDVVCDPYLGSGTTAKVAMEHTRLCIGAEVDPKHYPIIKQRLKTIKERYSGKNVQWIHTNGFLKDSLKNMIGGWV